MDNYYAKTEFSFAFVNNYFDFDNYDDPIQQYIDDSLFFELSPDGKKSANVYLSANEAELYDEVVGTAAKNLNFFIISKIREYSDDLDGGTDDTMASVFIRLDSAYDVYERK